MDKSIRKGVLWATQTLQKRRERGREIKTLFSTSKIHDLYLFNIIFSCETRVEREVYVIYEPCNNNAKVESTSHSIFYIMIAQHSLRYHSTFHSLFQLSSVKDLAYLFSQKYLLSGRTRLGKCILCRFRKVLYYAWI